MSADGPGFSADTDSVARHAERFDGLADRVGRIHRELRDALRDAGDCWGADEVGRSFADGHVDPAETTAGELGRLPERLGDMRERLTATATGYREADEGSAAGFGQDAG